MRSKDAKILADLNRTLTHRRKLTEQAIERSQKAAKAEDYAKLAYLRAAVLALELKLSLEMRAQMTNTLQKKLYEIERGLHGKSATKV